MTDEDVSAGAGAASDRLLREVVASAPVALLHLDADGVVRLAAGTALHRPPEQLLGRALVDLAESQEQVDRVHRALAGESLHALSTWGGKCWQVHYAPLWQDDTVTGVAAVFAEATGRAVAGPLTGPDPGQRPDPEHLRAAMQAAAEALIVVDPDGVITLANARCSELFGAPVSAGTTLRELLDAPTAAFLEEQLTRRAAGEQDRYELALARADGVVIWLLVSGSPMFTADGAFLGSVALLTDISLQKAVEQRLLAAALTDPLTGVANRATLADRLTQALARRDAGVVAVLFCDVDQLKTTNDRHGHAAGDQLLRQVTARISSVLRPADTIARYGGDEFVVVCESLHSPTEAAQLAERIRLAVARTDPGALTSSVSIGVATAPPHSTPDQLVDAADSAAYDAKRAGRNRVQLSE